VVNIALVQDERNLIFQPMNGFLGRLVVCTLFLKRSEFLLELMKVLSCISAVVIAFEIVNHPISSISLGIRPYYGELIFPYSAYRFISDKGYVWLSVERAELAE
jgi:hypothetical protein